MNVLLVAPMEPPRRVDIENSLESMQAVVGGLSQAVYPFDEPVALICNDEGKLLGLPLNRCLRLEDSGAIYDVIAGTFFLCAAPPDSEHFESLTEEQLARYTERFHNPEFFVPKGAEG